MGGNIFKDGSTRRYQASEYHTLCDNIRPLLHTICSRFDIIPAYKNKESFGDVDILCIPSKEWSNDLLNTVFSSGGNVVHNGDVWSLVFEEIQVDLITTNSKCYNASFSYFKFNDYGNIRGKVIRKFGLKYGHTGLTFPVKTEHTQLGEIVLTRDPQVIDEMFDFHIRTEINELEDMFKVITASKYFNPVVFAWEEMNAVARIRDKKRATYHAFLAHIEQFKDRTDFYQFNKDKSVYLPMIFEAFPHAEVEYNELMRKKAEIEAVRVKFNGNIVSSYTGLNDKELGMFMRKLKDILTNKMILEMSEEQIKNFIMGQL